MGRPRKIQGEVEQRLLYALEQGLTVRLACEYAGITTTTYSEELNRNPSFAAHARVARTKHLPKTLEEIRVDTDWRAKRAWVEMNFSEFRREDDSIDPAELVEFLMSRRNKARREADTEADGGG